MAPRRYDDEMSGASHRWQQACTGLIVLAVCVHSVSAQQTVSGANVVLQSTQAGGNQIALRADGSQVAVASDRTVSGFDIRERRQLFQFTTGARVSALAFDPAGARLAAGTNAGSIEIWSADGATLIAFLARPQGRIAQLAFGRDARQLLSVDENGVLARWDLRANNASEVFEPPAEPDEEVEAVGLSTRGDWLIQASGEPARQGFHENGRIRIWRAGDRRLVRQLEPDIWRTDSVAMSSDGRWAAAGAGHSVRVWEVEGGKLRHELRVNGDALDLAFSPDAGLLGVSLLPDEGQSRCLQVIDLGSGRVRWEGGHCAQVMGGLAFSENGRSLAATSADVSWVWQADTGAEQWAQSAYTGTADGVAFAPDGLTLMAASAGGRIRVWDTAAWRELPAFETPCRSTNVVRISPDASLLVAGDPCQTMKVWNARSRALIRTIDADQVQSLDVSSDGRLLAWADNATGYPASREWTIRVVDLSGVEVRPVSATPIQQEAFGSVRFSSLNDLVASDGRVMRRRHSRTDSDVWAFALGPGLFSRPALISSDRVAISSGREIRIHSMENGAIIRSLTGLSCNEAFAATKDGRWFACGGSRISNGFYMRDDHVVFVVDADTGQTAAMFLGHTDSIATLAFSPDDRWLVSGSRDRSLRVWSLAGLTPAK